MLLFLKSVIQDCPAIPTVQKFLDRILKVWLPGFDFILGKQPDSNWLNDAARRGLITRDSNFNDLFVQNFDQKITVAAQLEPVSDLTIDLNLNKTFTKNYSETFKDTTGTGNQFSHLSPYVNGGFNVSLYCLKYFVWQI